MSNSKNKLLWTVIFLILNNNIFSFTFKLGGSENMRCYRFKNPKDKKPIRVVEFFYESNLKLKDLQVQIHDELFKIAEDGQSNFTSYFNNQSNRLPSLKEGS